MGQEAPITIPQEAMSAVDGVMGNPVTPNPMPAAPSSPGIDPAAQDAVDGVMHTDTASQIRLNAGTAATVSPDQEAQHRQLAAATGIPAPAVAAQPGIAKQQAAAGTIDAGTIAQKTPNTAKFLTDPSNMAVAKDDIPNLQAVEGAVVQPTAGNVAKGLLGSFVLSTIRTFAGLNANITDSLGLPDWMTERSLNTIKAANAAEQSITPTFGSTPARWAYGGANSLMTSAPALAAAFFGGPLAAAGVFGGQSKFESYGKYRARGATPDEAAKGSDLEGAIMAGSSFLPLKYLTGALGKAGTGEFLANLIGRDVASMNVQTLATGAVDTAIANPTKSWKDYAKEIPGDIGQATTAALMFGGAFGTVNALARSAAGGQMKAEGAQQGAAFLKQLNDASAASKLRLRDPEAFSKFVAQAAEGGAVQDVYLNPKDLAQAGIDPAEGIKAMPELADKLVKADAEGNDVKIPVADFATKLAGTDFGNAVLDHLKTDPEGMSKIEADHFMQSQGPELQAQVDKILAEKQGDDTFKASTQAVHDNIMDQLTAANRFTADVNKPYASLISNFYAVQAARMGVTPEQMFAKYPVKISNGIGAPVPGEMQDKYSKALEASHKFIADRAADREANKRLFGKPQTLRGFIRKMGGIKDTGGELRSMGLHEQKKFKGVINGSGLDADHMRELAVEAGFLRDAPADQESTSTVNDLYDAIAQEARGKDVYSEQDAAKVQAYEDQNNKDSQVDEDERFVYGIQQHVEYTHGIDLTPEEALTFNSLTHDGVSEEDAVANIKDRRAGIFDQSQRGAFNPETSTISLLRAADLSTFLHESGHFFLETMNKMSSEAEAPEGVKADMQATLDWLGVKDLGEWNSKSLDEQRNAHEQFARGFEAYLFEGKSPNLEMQGVFSRFRSWLLNVYRDVKNLNVELSPEIRSVFDRMLATTDQIKQAEDARNFAPLFSDPPPGVEIGDFKKYHDLGVQATQTAIDELQARSMRDMQWASGAKAGVLKRLQRDAEEKRKAMKEHVANEVNNEPINKARAFIRKGELDGQKVDGLHRLDIDAVRQKIADKQMYYGTSAPNLDELQSKFGAYGVLGKDGIHPDTVAEMFGFSSGDELIKQLIEAEKPEDKINGITDQRMLERYGDLTSPEAIDKAADQAIHNEVRTRFVASEMSMLDKAVGNKKILASAAKQYAEQMIARLPVRDAVKPGVYLAAETRAAKEAVKALKAGDLAAAAKAKRDQLINSYAAKAAYDAQDEVDKIQRNAKRYDRKSVREKIGTDIALIDRLFDRYDLRKNPVEKENKQLISLRAWYDAQRESGYEPSIDERLMVENDRVHYQDMSMEALRGLDAAARSIEKVARSRKEVMVKGERMALDAVVKEMLAPMQERGDKFTKEQLIEQPQKGVDSVLSRALHAIGSKLRLASTDLKMPDYKRNYYDMHELAGPFGKYLFDPIFDRNYWKIDNLRSMSEEFRGKVEALGDDWQKSLTGMVTNTVLSDPDLAEPGAPALLKVTRARLIGMARHFGNESNFRKLFKGYGWEPEVVWKFVMDNMRENDWKAVQAEWDTFERYWPESEAMIKRLGGVVPDKIPLRPFKTPFGEMAGGYAPIDYDPIRSKLSAKFGEPIPDATTSLAKPQNYKATTTFNGSLNNRAEGYTDRMNLDYHYVTRRLHETIHDLAYREVLLDARKIIGDGKFRDQFMRSYGREEYSGLTKFVDNIADMMSRDTQMNNFEKAMQYARQGITQTGIGYRLTTVLKHGGSAAFKSFGALGGSGRGYLLARIARMSTGNLNADIEDAREKFPEIRARLLQMDRDYKVGGNSLYEAEDWRAKNDRYGHALIAWSDALSAIPTAHAAYDWAVSDGVPKNLGGTGEPMTHEDAVRFANKMVREAHGTANEAARANFLHDRGVKSLFGTIYAFQNNTFGQLGDMLDKTVVGGKFKNRPEILAKAMSQLIMPSVLMYWLTNGKDEKEGWGSWMAKAISGEVASTVPFVRDAWSMIEAQISGKGERSVEVPAISMLSDLVKVGTDAYKEFKGKDVHIIQDSLKALGEWMHIGGLGQAGKTLQYIHDAHTGKEHPKSTAEAIQGATIGVHKPKH